MNTLPGYCIGEYLEMIELDKAFETLEKKILDYDFRYLVVETELTENYIERLMPSCKEE